MSRGRRAAALAVAVLCVGAPAALVARPHAAAPVRPAPAHGSVGAERGRSMTRSVVLAASARRADVLRARARAILRERRFHGLGAPRPFAGVLGWLGDRLRPVVDAISGLGRGVPGGPPVLWTILAGAVLLAGAWLARHAIRRAGLAPGGAAAQAAARRERPAELEREAAAAERAGRFEEAVRLRFRAGLLRLDARGMLDFRPSLTTGEIAAAVRSDAFAGVASRFDAIAYGGEPATSEDAEAARRGWAAVLEEAGAR